MFVTPEIAQELKKRGFNEGCHAYYTLTTQRLCFSEALVTHQNLYEDYSLAPTWDEAFMWLRKNHIHVTFNPRSWDYINDMHIIKWSFWADILDIWMTNISIDDRDTDDPYDTYEKAREAAFIGALKLYDRLPEIREKLNNITNGTK